jgi:hypothetical protein
MQQSGLSSRGMSSVEVMILFAVTSIAVMLMAPFAYRHFQGYFFFDTARSIDRQFDPYDTTYDSSFGDSKSTTKRMSDAPMPSAPFYAGAGGSKTTLGGLEMQFINDYSGAPVHRESVVTKQMTTVSSGTGQDKYEYQDNMQPVY